MSRSLRIRRRAAPLAAIAVVALGAGVLAGAMRDSPAERTAREFADAWARGEYEAMWRVLTDEAQAEVPPQRLRELHEEALATATGVEVIRGRVADHGDGARVDMAVRTRVFGTVNGRVVLPVEDGRVAWEPHLAFPGLARGESLTRRTSAPPRAPILSRGGRPIVEGPAEARTSPLGVAGAEIAGSVESPQTDEQRDALYARGFPRTALVGTTGLERILEERAAGTPGGTLLAGERTLASSQPREAEPVRTTLDIGIQQAVTAALAGRFGGIAAIDARTAAVRGLAGIAFSGPQPPGSTFKIITATAALERELVRPRTRFPVETRAVIDGVELENANGESCGGTFVESFAHSCNSVFAPLGIEIGAEALVETAERYGFNEAPPLAGAAPSTLPPADEIASPLELGATAIGQGRVLATPLLLASIAQTVASGGMRRTPTVVPGEREPGVRVTTPQIARTLERMMVAVVEEGTGTAASLAPIPVAGKTGTAELEDTTDEDDPAVAPGSNTDAWFTAYAPARRPQLAVAVLLVRQGTGGETAAPAARVVLEAAVAGN